MRTLFYPKVGVMPFESAVSIFLKISRINFMTPAEVSKFFGSPLISVGTLCGWQRDDFIDRVAPHLPMSISNLPVGPAPAYRMRDVRKELVFCPQCIRFGYHSVFHMIKHHGFCSIHNRALATACELCTKNYINGFAREQLNRKKNTQCQACGFICVDMVTELKMRGGSSVVEMLQRNGERLSRWYQAVNELAMARQPEAVRYYSSSSGRILVGDILEQLTQQPQPDECARDRRFIQKVIWLANPAFIPARDGVDFTIRKKTVEQTCKDIEKKFLKEHMGCLSNIDLLTNNLNVKPQKFVFCPVALAYTLLRMKLAHRDWPNLAGGSVLNAGFSEFRDLVSGLGKTAEIRELRILFLHILGELQFMVQKQHDFKVICRYNARLSPKSPWPLYLRKASYSFRCSCKRHARTQLRICGPAGKGLDISANVHSEGNRNFSVQAIMVV